MDLSLACPECAEPIGEGDLFCEACGTDLRVRRGGTAAALALGPGPALGPGSALAQAGGPPTPGAGEPCRRCGEPAPAPGAGAEDEYCPGCGLRRPDGTDRVETDLCALAGVSDRGLAHARNEDAMELGTRRFAGVAAVVCDGVSTVRSPERAAREAAKAALAVLLADSGAPATPGAPVTSRAVAARGGLLVRRAVAAAATAVAELGDPGDRDAPSCTLVCAHLDHPDGPRSAPVITVGWVGDSRAYWLAGPGGAEPSRRLTTDHSWATAMIEAGGLDEAEALADRRAHAITRWLGHHGEPEPDVVSWRPAGPGLLLLCTDGLWNYLPGAEQLADSLPPPEDGAGPLEIARLLTGLALEAGGRDNITVVAVPVPAPADGPHGEETG